jgi:hypothetical protein
VLPALTGSEKNGKIIRSHIIVEKGGKILAANVGVGSKDSVPEAIKFIADGVRI